MNYQKGRLKAIQKRIFGLNYSKKGLTFPDENLKINNEDYYYSNVIARASKTMFNCKSAKTNLKSTGTKG